jgi:hypothetical protein
LDNRPYDRAVAFESMRQAGAVITTTESLLFAFLRDSTHPSFKQISQLIKQHNNNGINEFASNLNV